MKKVTSTLTTLLLCLYVSAQVGSLETTTFNPPNGYVINNLSALQNDYGNSLAVQPTDGKIVVAVVTTENVFKIVRYKPDGTLDQSFGTGGVVSMYLTTTPTGIPNACQSYTVGIQSTGKIVVGGYNFNNNDKDFVLARFDTNGNLDPTFGSASTPGIVMTPVSPINNQWFGEDVINNIVIQSDNSIIAAGFAYNGTDNDFAVAKYSAQGVLDGTFGTGGYTITNINSVDKVSAVAVNSTGSIYVAGTSNVGSTTGNYTLLRYTPGGILDQTITSGISGNDEGYGIAIQSDDYVLITGKKPGPFNSTDQFIGRYKPDGTLDGTFGTGGIVTTNVGPSPITNEEGWGIAVQSDGKIIVSGTVEGNSSTDYDFLLARYSSTGSPDATFGSSGLSRAAISSNEDIGKAIKLFGTHIYVTGYAKYTTSGTMDFALAAFNDAAGAPLPLVLSQFYAQKQTSKVMLQWQTSSEEDLKQFVIERSNDGKTYKVIGTVAAAGNSTITKNYSFADQSPFMSSLNYYRLLMQDVDGNYKYSKVLTIKFDGQLTSNMQVYPNPVKDLLQVQLPDGLKGTVSLQIIDMQGRVVKRNNLASDGNALNTTVDVTSLLKGLYILKAQAGNTTVITRFTKQ